MVDTGSSDYPVIPLTSRTVGHVRRGDVPLYYTQIGRVSFYMHEGQLVRVMCGDLDLGIGYSIRTSNLFPGETIKQVSMAELKFHLLRLLGEEALRIIDPFIDKKLNE